MGNKNIITCRLLLFLMALVSSCSGEADVRRDFDYEVRVEKYHEDVPVGETRELIFSILREGEYENTGYGMSHFVRKGSGTLSDGAGRVLEENTAYGVDPSGSHLFYTVLSRGPHKIEFLFRDSFGKEREILIELSGTE